ncbi:MAG TPA: SIS domain-containing protein [Gemmatimonadales bacterium]|jgi:D-sedoheptulose 7-phosphate isomerase|nr:SIS domain-containing protein [Gemmatimonadales bacterium]
MSPAERIRAGLASLARTAAETASEIPAVERLAARCAATLRDGGTIFFAGNGGSAADAQHIATEYVVRLRARRRAFRAVALTTDSSLLTAAGNDLGFEQIFARQVEALGRPGDLLVLHSTSGASANLCAAARAARSAGVTVAALLGSGGGALRALADLAVVVPSDDTSRIQEIHLALEHLIVELVEDELAKGGGAER